MRPFPLLSLLILVFVSSCKKRDKKAVYPLKEKIIEAVYSSATVQPYNYYTVYSTLSGVIHKRYIKEGDEVEMGSPLFMVESKTTDLNYDNAKLVYELAQKNLNSQATILREIESELQNTKLKLKNDSLNYFRQKTLFDKNVGSEQELDAKKLAYTTSKNTLSIVKNRYNRSLQELKTDAQIKENQLKTNKELSKDLLMTSNLNGRVYDVMKKEAEFIAMQEPFAIIGSADSFKVELLVDEMDVARVALDQKVIIALNAYPKKVFEAKVAKIYPMMDTQSQSFKVDCYFTSKPPTLYMGLSGEANIIINEKPTALTIPREYLVNDSTVSTVDGLVKVKTGIYGLDNVEIIAGLNEKIQLKKPETN